MTQEKTLHELYQLLWEQIKDSDIQKGLCAECYSLFNHHEFDIISEHIRRKMPFLVINGRLSIFGWLLNKQGTADRKAFVLRMIEETKNN